METHGPAVHRSGRAQSRRSLPATRTLPPRAHRETGDPTAPSADSARGTWIAGSSEPPAPATTDDRNPLHTTPPRPPGENGEGGDPPAPPADAARGTGIAGSSEPRAPARREDRIPVHTTLR